MLALISGTVLVAVIGMVIAVPLGLLSAVLLSEYASSRVRTVVKPILETIAGVPTIVLGFFGLNFVAPQILRPLLGEENIGVFSALSGGIVVGLLITPLIASISEDAMRAVPRGLREAAFAMGAAGPAWTTTLAGYEALCITTDHRVLSTPGLDRYRTPA